MSNDSNVTNKWIAGLICPACNRKDQLFIGHGGFVTCSANDCPNPDYAEALQQAVEVRCAKAALEARIDEVARWSGDATDEFTHLIAAKRIATLQSQQEKTDD